VSEHTVHIPSFLFRSSKDSERKASTKLREKAKIEKDIATRNGNLKHFKIKWEPLIRSKFIGDVNS